MKAIHLGVLMVLLATTAFGGVFACGDASSGAGGVADEGGLPSTERPTGASCEKDAGTEGGHTFSSSVCASSAGIPGCRMCLSGVLSTPDQGSVCVNACHIGAQECAAGQTCTPQPQNSSRASGGDCGGSHDALGYCK